MKEFQICNYRLQGKVMFSEASVSHSVRGGRGLHPGGRIVLHPGGIYILGSGVFIEEKSASRGGGSASGVCIPPRGSGSVSRGVFI